MPGMLARSSWLPPVECRHVDCRGTIEITVDLATGWKRKTKDVRLLRGDKARLLSATIPFASSSLCSPPGGFREESGTFPDDAEASGDKRGISYNIAKSLLTGAGAEPSTVISENTC